VGSGENERPGRRVDLVAVKLKHRVAAQHQEELLISGGVALVVLVDDALARRACRPSSHSKRRDAQVVSNRPIMTACVGEILDLVQLRDRVTSHGPSVPSP
jgi:hypothetical protein